MIGNMVIMDSDFGVLLNLMSSKVFMHLKEDKKMHFEFIYSQD